MLEMCKGCLWWKGVRCEVFDDPGHWLLKGRCPAKITERWQMVKLEEEIAKYRERAKNKSPDGLKN
ncbi:MAG TPA: hypothetical protein GXX19_09020 [Syntrophomonadaceae bacterium]|nr:hypothetical protein [Syntrophomonadaceae bacterium]